MSERITWDQIVEAQKKTGLGLTRGEFHITPSGCTCPIGLMYVAATGHRPETMNEAIPVVDWAREKYGPEYIEGFWNGFDGYDHSEKHSKFIEGYADGVAVYEKAKHAKLLDPRGDLS